MFKTTITFPDVILPKSFMTSLDNYLIPLVDSGKTDGLVYTYFSDEHYVASRRWRDLETAQQYVDYTLSLFEIDIRPSVTSSIEEIIL